MGRLLRRRTLKLRPDSPPIKGAEIAPRNQPPGLALDDSAMLYGHRPSASPPLIDERGRYACSAR
jgi:hypothetical protein